MKNFVSLGLVGSLLLVASATAQPAIYSLGGGVPASVTSPVGGTYFMGGVAASGVLGRWSLSGAGVLTAQDLGGSGPGYISDDGTVLVGSVLNTSPTYTGNTATGVSPAFSTTPTLVSAALPTNEFAGTIWTAGSGLTTRIPPIPVTPALMCYGQGSSGGSGGIFLSGHAISGNGRYVVGQGYISNYNSAAGTTIATSTFTWRPWIWDSVTNTQRILPTPFRTSSNTWRRRTGTGYAVSNDGLVIAGYQEHSVATTPTADPDGARPVVWRWNSGTSSYDMTYLPNGVNGSGFPYTVTATPTSMQMNTLGTIIVGKAVDNGGGVYLAKWTWDAGTSTWNAPVSIGSNLTSPATWLPASVTSCGQPPTLTISGMSEDGNTIVGQAVYSTCSGFMSGGFIWHASDGFITDWYDYLNEAGAPDVAPNGYYGPIGDLGDPARACPAWASPPTSPPTGPRWSASRAARSAPPAPSRPSRSSPAAPAPRRSPRPTRPRACSPTAPPASS